MGEREGGNEPEGPSSGAGPLVPACDKCFKGASVSRGSSVVQMILTISVKGANYQLA